MAAWRQMISGFIGGELDPMMAGRVETDNYGYGLALCENFVALAEGPLVKRGGFEMIRAAQPDATWLSTFRFSITQEYALEWGTKVRFFTNGGRVETAPNVPYELAVPYSPAEAPALSFQQSYDRLYINHPAHAPASIARTSAVTFSFGDLVLLNGPFKDENTDQAVTLTVSATTGSGITVTASSAIFAAGHVGALLRIQAKDFSTIKAWEATMDAVTIGMIVRSDGKAYTALTAGKTGSIQPTHTEGAAWDGLLKNDVLNAKGPYGVQWDYRHDLFGIVRITAIGGGGTTATADVLRRIPDSCTSVATYRWAHCCFSSAEGWPALVALWQGRMIHFKDFDLVASVAGDFGGGRVNFAAYTDSGKIEPDLAFRRTLAIEDPPVWVAADRKLLLGTATRELAVGPTNAQAAVSGDNISADPQSFYGSEALRPVQVGVQTVFIERGGRRVRSAGYDFGRDRYVADDLTAAARHVTASGVKQLAWQRSPYAFAHAVRNDGQIAVHADSKMEIKGWSRMVLGGAAKALSAVSVVGSDGQRDELWLLIERVNGLGATVREIWKQSAWRELGDDRAECFFVDGGVRIDAAGGDTSHSGLDHLAGQPVAVLVNGAVVPDLTVSALGVLDLPATAVPASAHVVIVGLAYTALARTLPPEFKGPRGTVQGMLKRVRKLVLRLLESMGLFAAGHDEYGDGPFEELIDRRASDAMDAPVPLYSGDTQGLIDTAYDSNGVVIWKSDRPLPAVITSAVLSLEVDVNDV